MGEVRAEVHGRRARPYQVRVRIRSLDEQEWDRLIEVIAAQVGHAAALLDGELPPEVVADAAAARVGLLPGPGELGPRCSCPDWADPCKHAAAVCYLVADLLDDDPFALLLMRGRSREEVLAALRRRRGGRLDEAPASPSFADPGLIAKQALSRDVDHELPRAPLPPPRPMSPPPLAGNPPTGIDRDGLLALAADAAVRAHALLLSGEGTASPVEILKMSAEADLARRAAQVIGTGAFTALARRSAISPRELTRWAAAWRDGGPGGFEVLREEWNPPPEAVAEGRAALGAKAAVRRNRVTGAGIQLRLGRDGRWYRFTRVGKIWELDGAPAADPASLVGSE